MTETTLAVFASESDEPGAIGHITPHSEAKVTYIAATRIRECEGMEQLCAPYFAYRNVVVSFLIYLSIDLMPRSLYEPF